MFLRKNLKKNERMAQIISLFFHSFIYSFTIHISIHPNIYLSIYLGSVRNDGLEDRELDKYSSINETVAMVKSFQIERQLNHSRQYLPFNSGIILSSK